MGGVPLRLCPDNLKAGTSKPCIYDPDISPVYFDMAKHYNTTVLPSRPGKPRDKAKVECAVLLAQRWILACLRNRQFFSISEINQEITKLLEKLNNKPMQKLGISRNQLFEHMEKDKLLPLPEKRYEFVQFAIAKVNKDYHIELKKNYYSVPFRLIGQNVSVRYSDVTVEIFYNNERVASHRRLHQPGAFSTDNSHRPENHRKALEWSPERLKKWAEKIGPNTKKVIESIFSGLRYEEHGIRKCLGILSLAGKNSHEALEAACQTAYKNKILRHKHIKTIIENNKKHSAKTITNNASCGTTHENVRGASYYSEYVNKGVKNAV
jgi:transposase